MHILAGDGPTEDRRALEVTGAAHPSKPDVDITRQMSEMEDNRGGVGVLSTVQDVQFCDEGYCITGLSADVSIYECHCIEKGPMHLI